MRRSRTPIEQTADDALHVMEAVAEIYSAKKCQEAKVAEFDRLKQRGNVIRDEAIIITRTKD